MVKNYHKSLQRSFASCEAEKWAYNRAKFHAKLRNELAAKLKDSPLVELELALEVKLRK